MGSRVITAVMVVLLACLCAATFVLASPTQSPDEVDRRVRALTTELRCLVCQNESIADSNAALARDLRRQVRELVQSGASDAQVRTHLRERFGDFVLYRPPVARHTLALWLGPALLLAGGALAWLWVMRRRPAASGADADAGGESDDPLDPELDPDTLRAR